MKFVKALSEICAKTTGVFEIPEAYRKIIHVSDQMRLSFANRLYPLFELEITAKLTI